MTLIQSVARALQILELFDEATNSLSIKEISNQLDLNKSTVHALLKTLKQFGYIQQDAFNSEYSLGWKLFERGNLLVSQLDFKKVASRHLQTLNNRTNETIHLVTLLGQEALYIDKINGHNTLTIYSRIGKKAPLHSSAVGKILTAYLPENQFEAVFKAYEFTTPTANTISNIENYKKELSKVRQQGFAMDQEENELGIICMAMPIYDYSNKVVASVSVSTPKIIFTKQKKKKTLADLSRCVNDISHELGYKMDIKGDF
ncbi:MAG: IclR family transcriptional regulator [Kurthia sp.]|nr:IclR family transcriptional regulator [Candidatus Kurthia equi]